MSTLTTMKDYVHFFITKFIRPHLLAEVKEVQVVFDNPRSQAETPEKIEQARRDQSSQSVNHHCSLFQASEKLPNKWRSVLECRQCKQVLTLYATISN